MADKTIGALPKIENLSDDSRIPVEQQGAAGHLTGEQLKRYVESAAQLPISRDGNWWVWDQTAYAYVDTGEKSQGNGIASVAQTGSMGHVTNGEIDYRSVEYTITFDDGSTFSFWVNDGKKGDPGRAVSLVDITLHETTEEGNVYRLAFNNLGALEYQYITAPRGDAGAAPVLQMGEVQTLEPGSDATATLTGTAEKPVLNLSIPRGASGNSPTDEQVAAVVSDWLNEHPEATTTVEDGSINPDKTTWMRQVFHNIFNKEDNDFRDGYHFYTDGNAATTGGGTANYFVSGYIPVISGKQYFINAAPNQLSTKCFDSLKTYISPLAETALPIGCIIDIPDGVAYIRFSVAKNVMTADTAQVYEYMGEVWEYDTYKNLYSIVVTDAGYSKAIADMVEGKFVDGSLAPADLFADESLRYKQMKGWKEFHWNVVDPSTLEPGAIDSSGKEFNGYTGYTYNARSGYMPVTPGETLHFLWMSVYGYDADRNFVGKVVDKNGVATVPEGVYFVRCHGYHNTNPITSINIFRRGYGKYDLRYNSVYPYENGFPVFKTEDSKEGFKAYLGIHPWADMRFGIIGDSFTSPGTWCTVMCNNLRAEGFSNHAVSGGAFVDRDGVPKTAYEQAQEMVTNGESPSVILITLGTNDANNSVTIGDIVESNSISDFDLTTYTGGMQACLNYLQNNFPNAIIYVGWTPMGGLGNGTKVEYITRMQEVCLMYGVEYIETRTCGVTRFSDVYAECYEAGVNGGHPTGVGQQKIGEYMTRLMQSKR